MFAKSVLVVQLLLFVYRAGAIVAVGDALCSTGSTTYEVAPEGEWAAGQAPPLRDLLDDLLVNATGCKYKTVPGDRREHLLYSGSWTGSLRHTFAVRAPVEAYIRIYANNVYKYGLLMANDTVRVWNNGRDKWSDMGLGLPKHVQARHYTPLQIIVESNRIKVQYVCDKSRLLDWLNIESGAAVEIRAFAQAAYWNKLLYDCPDQ